MKALTIKNIHKGFLLIFLIGLGKFTAIGQVQVSKNLISIYQKVAQEKLFVHTNASVLFPGEKLSYKVYGFNNETKKTDNISKIGYVALIGKDKKIIFEHKIRIAFDGYSSGDFIIPSDLSTGNYKLIAYTQWMRNAGDTNFSVNEINIINPFLAYTPPASQAQKTNQEAVYSNAALILQLPKKVFSKRENVILELKTAEKKGIIGNFSISVRKVSKLNTPNYKSIEELVKEAKYVTRKNTFVEKQNSYEVYAPEHKGELITGVVKDKKGNPMAGVGIALSIPGDAFILTTTKTNTLGMFYFDIESSYSSSKAVLQVTSSHKDDVLIEVHQPGKFSFDHLKFKDVYLTTSQIDAIKKRIIASQIENAYSEVKKDQIISTKATATFYKPDYVYHLDDFKRFPSISETMVEVVEHSWITRKRGKHTFHVRDYKSEESALLPLILIDGMLVQNHEELFNLPVAEVKTISIITDRFLYQNVTYGGVILVDTASRNYELTSSGNYLKKIRLQSPEENKIYYQPNYQTNRSSLTSIPDFRYQLYWNPSVQLNSSGNQVSFFTSDVTGKFEIVLEGFTSDDKPISIRETIVVK